MRKKRIHSDKFKTARGGPSRFLRIACQKCGAPICTYQKDGIGNLRRMYIDRIIEPTVSLLRKDLACPMGHLLGIKILYIKEKRIAFRLIGGSITKRTV